jgi:diguanylate cyclase (GGDEF)-like protein
MTVRPLRQPDELGAAGVVAAFVDVTDRKALADHLHHVAHHDDLTGIANRKLFLDRLERASIEAGRHGIWVAVMLLDLDGFKAINDTHGHEAGDGVLIEVARRLRDVLRAGDTVARFGGDEFAALLDGITDRAEVAAIAERLMEALTASYRVNSVEASVSASVGIALRRGSRLHPNLVIRDADVALYRLKAAGKGGYLITEAESVAPFLAELNPGDLS